MLLISKLQLNKLDDEVKKTFIKKVIDLLITDFNQDKRFDSINKEELYNAVSKMISKAGYYGFTTEASVVAYVVLSFLNGENFLETKEFKIFKYHLKLKTYDPNKYIFEIPSKQ